MKPAGLSGQEIEEVPLRHEDQEPAARRQVTEVGERHTAALREGLGDARCDAHQRGHHLPHAADEMIGAVGGDEIGHLLRQLVGLLFGRVLEIAGARHAAQPFLDVARLHPARTHHVVQRHGAFALHGAEQPGARADVGHARGHRPRHVAKHLVDGELGLFLVHDRRIVDSGA